MLKEGIFRILLGKNQHTNIKLFLPQASFSITVQLLPSVRTSNGHPLGSVRAIGSLSVKAGLLYNNAIGKAFVCFEIPWPHDATHLCTARRTLANAEQRKLQKKTHRAERRA
ncbi:uncharacterized protein LOC118513630 [Anopheles stephensi]|uniref:uncharacterized protein LOC118513630 n=1 Tax=Anopheles stephensi TaxID=30069 RepID=UPI0016588F03|nr:uncharacterized protein LOC118513630 [Anopheles stephensi]